MEYFDQVEGDKRLTTLPIARQNVFSYYQDAYRSYWTPEDIDFSQDMIHYTNKLSNREKHFVDYVLAFFASSDQLVNMNLAARFKQDVPMVDAGYFYDFQIMVENIHAHTYSVQLDTVIPDTAKRTYLLNAINNIPIIGEMSKYIIATMDSTEPLPVRLLRMACVEGVFFTGCFCVIYWLQSKGLMPGLAHANELISRDEALHTLFALYLYTIIKPEHKISTEKVYAVFSEAVDIAARFIEVALPVDLPEMNQTLMLKYIKNSADNLLMRIDVAPLYNVKHEFPFMNQINLLNRTNFFERRVSEYSKPTHSDKVSFEVNYDI